MTQSALRRAVEQYPTPASASSATPSTRSSPSSRAALLHALSRLAASHIGGQEEGGQVVEVEGGVSVCIFVGVEYVLTVAT